MSKHRIAALAVAALVMIVNTNISLAVLTDTVVTSSEDSYIRGGIFAGDNFGSNSQLRIKADNRVGTVPANVRKTYIKFDISSLADPDLSLITSVTLDLSFVSSGIGNTTSGTVWEFEVFGLDDGLDSWVESGIDWNNAPANLGGSNSFDTNSATSLATFLVTGEGTGQVINLSNSNFVNFLQNDTDQQVSFLVSRLTTQQAAGDQNYVHALASREAGAGAPELEITQDIPPSPSVNEPPVVLMFGMGFVALLLSKRRKQ